MAYTANAIPARLGGLPYDRSVSYFVSCEVPFQKRTVENLACLLSGHVHNLGNPSASRAVSTAGLTVRRSTTTAIRRVVHGRHLQRGARCRRRSLLEQGK